MQAHEAIRETRGLGGGELEGSRGAEGVELAPRARVHLDSGAAATIDALVIMSRADVLLMGSSGFSTWSAIFSCGVKIGPPGRPMMPMRHVPYANTLVARSGDFSKVALPELRRVWGEYWRCKRDPACRPSLCAPKHVSDARWTASRLAQQCIAQPHGAQWHVPSEPPGAAAADGVASETADGRSRDVDGILEARRACALKAGTLKGGAAGLIACIRSRWSRNVSTSLSLKSRIAIVAAANRSAMATAVAATSLQAAPSSSDGVAVGADTTSRRQTKTIQKDGKSFLVWAERR